MNALSFSLRALAVTEEEIGAIGPEHRVWCFLEREKQSVCEAADLL